MLRRSLSLLIILSALPALPAAAALQDGSFTHTTPAYSASLTWSTNTAGVVVDGTVTAGARTASLRQTARVGDTFLARPATAPIVIRSAATTLTSEGAPRVQLSLWLPVGEVSGSVTLTFLDSHIVHRSEFHVPSGAFAPTVESTTRVDWQPGFASSGSVDGAGTIRSDDGRSLDAYGDWRDAHRYGVFGMDPGARFVGHGRLAQGDLANYLNDGRMRVGPAFSEVRSFFNGFLDVPSAGLSQGLWTVDALSFLPDGSTPGAYGDVLAAFPGFGPAEPPAVSPADDAQVVIAIADTGVNPYHRDFRNPGYTAHPSTYISGYPAAASALTLTLGAEYAASRTADDAPVWSRVQSERLYWIPGTKIIGAYSIGNAPTSLLPNDTGFPPRRIIDDDGHGTGSASVAAGYGHGTCPACLLVIIEGTEEGVAWAATQPWIDMISNSYGPLASLPVGNSHQSSRAAYRAGKSVLYSAGNGMSGTGIAPDRNLSFTRPTSGPTWVITVGAASPRNDQDHSWHGVPSDVISYGSGYPAADGFSVAAEQTFSGTSCATPITAGVEGSLLLHARARLGDVTEGTAGGILASLGSGSAPAAGPLADGTLTRNELEDVLLKTAIPTRFDPEAQPDPTTVPGTPAGFVSEGYGLVNRTSLAAGLQVLDGAMPLPHRPMEDAWIQTTDVIRQRFWGYP